MNRRKFNRIAIDSRFDTDLFVYGRPYKNIIIRDLSLSGLFALGEYDGQECDECELLLKPLDRIIFNSGCRYDWLASTMNE